MYAGACYILTPCWVYWHSLQCMPKANYLLLLSSKSQASTSILASSTLAISDSLMPWAYPTIEVSIAYKRSDWRSWWIIKYIILVRIIRVDAWEVYFTANQIWLLSHFTALCGSTSLRDYIQYSKLEPDQSVTSLTCPFHFRVTLTTRICSMLYLGARTEIPTPRHCSIVSSLYHTIQ